MALRLVASPVARHTFGQSHGSVQRHAALQQVRTAINQAMPFTPGMQINKPNLASPMLPEQDVPKMPMYGLGKDWVVIYTKDGRPYYHHPESGTTQWAHPGTGVITPPSRPPEKMMKINPIIKYPVRLVSGIAALIMAIPIVGASPFLGRLVGGEKGSPAVVQTRIL
mmetsp:Transcript_37022/g.73269  ORF Transcript_37022/g.73269 Transcript_37022/m.73269 type:complete len:167 (+) Transcript_37022:58-558(+)